MAYPQGSIPAARAQRRSVRTHLHAANAVLVSVEHADSSALQGVPTIHRVVVVTSK